MLAKNAKFIPFASFKKPLKIVIFNIYIYIYERVSDLLVYYINQINYSQALIFWRKM